MSKRRHQHFVRPETIRRLSEITGASESRIRGRINADPKFIEGDPTPDDEETVVVGSVLPMLAGSRRETCSRCSGPVWLVDSPVPGASFLCARCYVRDEAPEMAWMLGPDVN
jgi:hypothetical protein